jgi:hypothetical protein
MAIFFSATVPPLVWFSFAYPYIFIVVACALTAATVGLVGW